MPLSWAHPIVREWFAHRFDTPTEPQTLGWPHIVARRDTLISAPTGSGKTLAAFLACINSLVRAAGNDTQKNLDGPLAEIVRLAAERGQPIAEIRTAVRTGDTLMPERRAMLQRPPPTPGPTPGSLH